MASKSYRVGFVSTRFSGTDGVSLESAKWSDVLTQCGYTCFYFAGESDRPAERSRVVPEAHFDHPDIRRINRDLFDDRRRTPETSHAVHKLWQHLKMALREFIRDFQLDLLLVENALAIPMNVPLGLALTEVIAETNIPTIAHHHDFAWERRRYAVTAADDYLQAAFPPAMSNIHHVVINSFGARQLAYRTGMRSTLIPNVMDFENPPDAPDDYSASLRQELGLSPDDVFLLQPTRVVPRKRIERAIELARRLHLPSKLVISHSSGDEGDEYLTYLADYAKVMGVEVIFAADRFAYYRGRTTDGRKIYSLADAYQRADLVTYPSHVEGFGNAFLEAIYYRQPLLMSTYEIFRRDIEPKGFEVIGFDEFITRQTIEHARRVLNDRSLAARMVEHNYQLGRQHYSYAVLRQCLPRLVQQSCQLAF
ncbi:MAG TPA: glycosyltransferase [Planctomycetaceae bacterium]|nr:glycosyltransferase [Planctomycetaceae bacterium]HIQ20020.1 glycosyltransferase [Planctomycetota bacterium]